MEKAVFLWKFYTKFLQKKLLKNQGQNFDFSKLRQVHRIELTKLEMTKKEQVIILIIKNNKIFQESLAKANQ